MTMSESSLSSQPQTLPQTSWGIIYCPREGSGQTHRRWDKIRRYLDEAGVSYDYVQSEGPGSVERLAAMLTRTGYATIIVVGGDAALGRALTGIMSANSPIGGHPTLGVIPNGFGNDFAKYWGFRADDYKETIDALIAHRMRRIDVGRLTVSNEGGEGEETLYFLNLVSLGVVSQIVRLRHRTGSLLGLRQLSYLTSALLLLTKRTSFRFCLRIAGETIDKRAMSVSIGSGPGYGLTPSAIPYNGKLDVTMVSKPVLSQIFHGLWLLFTGRFLTHKGLSVWRTDRLELTGLNHVPLSVDGGVYHKPFSRVKVGILPEEINFLVK